MCGASRLKNKDETSPEGQVSDLEASESGIGTCTNVVISDKYVLTAAHCTEGSAR